MGALVVVVVVVVVALSRVTFCSDLFVVKVCVIRSMHCQWW